MNITFLFLATLLSTTNVYNENIDNINNEESLKLFQKEQKTQRCLK